MQVDPVQQRPGDAGTVAFDSYGSAATGMGRISQITAGAGVCAPFSTILTQDGTRSQSTFLSKNSSFPVIPNSPLPSVNTSARNAWTSVSSREKSRKSSASPNPQSGTGSTEWNRNSTICEQPRTPGQSLHFGSPRSIFFKVLLEIPARPDRSSSFILRSFLPSRMSLPNSSTASRGWRRYVRLTGDAIELFGYYRSR